MPNDQDHELKVNWVKEYCCNTRTYQGVENSTTLRMSTNQGGGLIENPDQRRQNNKGHSRRREETGDEYVCAAAHFFWTLGSGNWTG
mmetsp:Transcript_14654/g.22766  ORF Transcript_14654/g.22766 Transcript_14654/m.22766 type:complete len:87 (+) Transcript_14654:285-545(+)